MWISGYPQGYPSLTKAPQFVGPGGGRKRPSRSKPPKEGLATLDTSKNQQPVVLKRNALGG
ncbi:hypothetical protein PGT21_010394 [Puccinia graminis f. sp. tritici]|uniref:Uncharacterized protein n=1 Tax=Puccinia graminis f. sp. tritici TaxID=56615 RepID=A0A5B0QW20_PUCGR|nr:hypothetical protein PGT21_010394 [Puccinia graminis f. sp. tritici]